MKTSVYYRLPLLFAAISAAISLAILYMVGITLPSLFGASCWIAAGIVCVSVFRAHRVAALSLSSVAVAFYLYICLAFLWPAIFPNLFISVHATAFQTPDIFAKANHLAAIGLWSLIAGWLLGAEAVTARASARQDSQTLPVGPRAFAIAFVLAAPMLILAFPTESILSVGYNGAAKEQTIGAALEINVLKPALNICALVALMALLARPSRLRWAIWGAFTAILVFILGFATGDRVEEIGCLVAVGWVLLSRRPQRSTPKKWIASAAVLCIFLLILGEVRSTLPSQPLDLSSLWAAATKSLEVVPTSDSSRMKPSTNGDAALTFCVVIGLVETGVLRTDYGETFLNYLNMTLPRFMNSDRPVELQVQLQRLSMTGGGLYILAEPYLAGGAIGIVFVLGLFGFGFGALESLYSKRALGGASYYAYALLLSCVPRWFLYSILAMYKHVLTGLLIIIAIKALEAIFVRRAAAGEVRSSRALRQPA